MHTAKKIGLLILIIIALVALALARELKELRPTTTTVGETTEYVTEPSIVFGEVTVNVELAATDEARIRGLSGRTELAEGTGMLFVFETSSDYGFWMNNMLFAIDMLWLDEDGRVVHVVSDARPESFPTIFKPTEPARYVLEVPSGFSERYGVVAGDSATLNL